MGCEAAVSTILPGLHCIKLALGKKYFSSKINNSKTFINKDKSKIIFNKENNKNNNLSNSKFNTKKIIIYLFLYNEKKEL